MKCIYGQCKRNGIQFTIKKENAVNPHTCEVGDLRQLFGFFQYKSPNTSSYQSDLLDVSLQDDLFLEMTKKWAIEQYNVIPSNSNFEKESYKYALQGECVCSYCKRFLLKRKKTINSSKESDFDCLMRHIRNSLAHGRVFVIHGGNSIKILFEDYDIKTKSVSARIVCNQSDLQNWKALINKFIKEN